MSTKVFIGYSKRSEGLGIAVADNLLRSNLTAVRWPNAFDLGQGIFEGLLQKAHEYDFGVFAFSPADFLVTEEGRQGKRTFLAPNLVFELGLFVGIKGRERAFLISPENYELPADLKGIVYASYNPNESDLGRALSGACNKILAQIQSLPCTTCYFLLNKLSGKCLDVKDWGMEPGNPIMQWPYHGGTNQLWLLERLEDRWFKITSQHSGWCLQVRAGSLEEDAPLEQGVFAGKEYQEWSLIPFPDGSYQIKARHSGKVATIQGASDASEALAVQRTWTHHDSYLWWVAGRATLR